LRLFGDFAGFVDFFLLQDLVDEHNQTVKFMAPFGDGDWPVSPHPSPRDVYLDYRERATGFIEARNKRIAAQANARPPANQPAQAVRTPTSSAGSHRSTVTTTTSS
jgi:hypothetical protein